MSHQTTNTSPSIKVWDPLIRIFHWSLVFFFSLAYVTEDDWMTIHSYAGYGILLLILFRLIWGLIGTQHARFHNFVPSLSELFEYLRQISKGKAKRYLGHNPAGSVMVLALLASVSLTVLTGVVLFATEGSGPLAETFFASWSSDLLEEIHEFFANFTLLLVALHIAGMLVTSLLHGENLVLSMINGKKKERLDNNDE